MFFELYSKRNSAATMSTWNDDFEFDQWFRWKKEAEAERWEEQRRLLAEDDKKETARRRQRAAIKTWLVRVDKGDTEYASLYLDTFIKNGYATLAKCAELTKETLDKMGVLLFHREDILRNLPKIN